MPASMQPRSIYPIRHMVSHLQHYNHGAILFEGDQRTAQVINLGHGGTSIDFCTTTTVPDLCRRPHSFWTLTRTWARAARGYLLRCTRRCRTPFILLTV